MSSYPDISIVVLNYNTSDLLGQALESIVRTADKLTVTVTVIDNASTDGGLSLISDVIKSDSRFSFIQREKNIGWAAINDVLKKPGRYILTLDSDAVLNPGTLQELLFFMDTHPDAGAATAKLLNLDGSPQLYYRRILTPWSFFFTTLIGRLIDKYFLKLRAFKRYRYEDLDVNVVSEVEQPAWPCLIWRKESLGQYIVDKKIPFYFVDVDMSKRVYSNGYKIYLVPSATAIHHKSTSFGRTNKAWRDKEYYRSLRVYLFKHYPIVSCILIPLSLLDQIMRMGLREVFGVEPLR